MDDAGTVDFSTTNYWSSSTFGTYIYNESNDIVKPIVDEYVNYLNEKLTNATGNLLSYDQATYLGCDNSLHNCSSNDLAGGPVLNPAPEWLYSRTFWVGSVFGSTDVFIIDSEGFY